MLLLPSDDRQNGAYTTSRGSPAGGSQPSCILRPKVVRNSLSARRRPSAMSISNSSSSFRRISRLRTARCDRGMPLRTARGSSATTARRNSSSESAAAINSGDRSVSESAGQICVGPTALFCQAIISSGDTVVKRNRSDGRKATQSPVLTIDRGWWARLQTSKACEIRAASTCGAGFLDVGAESRKNRAMAKMVPSLKVRQTSWCLPSLSSSAATNGRSSSSICLCPVVIAAAPSAARMVAINRCG